MTAHPEGKRTIKHSAGGWLYSIMFKPGWPRWVLLAVAVVLFLLSALAITGGTDYREDPSALVPRSVQSYVETKDLDHLLRTVGTWRLWDAERRSSGQEQYNQIQVDIAGLLGERVAGLGTPRLLRWLSGAGKAAYCVNKDESGVESWAVFLHVNDPHPLLADLFVDQGLQVEVLEGTRDSGVIKLSGSGEGVLYLGVLKPWLIISSAETLPTFALASLKRPAYSLASSGIVPKWRSGTTLRGVYNPAYHADKSSLSAYSIVTGWMAPEMRVNFISSFRNGVETTMNADVLTDKVKGGGLWPLFWVLLLILAILCLVLILAIVLVMVGWGGWLKAMAMRSGVAPAPAPAEVAASAAFKEDAGLQTNDHPAAATEQVGVAAAEPAPEVAKPAEDAGGGEEEQSVSGINSGTNDKNQDNVGETGTSTNSSM